MSGPKHPLPLQTLLAQTAKTLRYNFVLLSRLRGRYLLYISIQIIPRTLMKYYLDYTVIISNHDQILRTP